MKKYEMKKIKKDLEFLSVRKSVQDHIKKYSHKKIQLTDFMLHYLTTKKKIHIVASLMYELIRQIKEDERTIPIAAKVQKAYSKLIELTTTKDSSSKIFVYLKNMFIEAIMSYVYHDYVLLESKKILDTCRSKNLSPEKIDKILLEKIRDIVSKLDIEEKIFKEVLRENMPRFQYLIFDELGLDYLNKKYLALAISLENDKDLI